MIISSITSQTAGSVPRRQIISYLALADNAIVDTHTHIDVVFGNKDVIKQLKTPQVLDSWIMYFNPINIGGFPIRPLGY